MADLASFPKDGSKWSVREVKGGKMNGSVGVVMLEFVLWTRTSAQKVSFPGGQGQSRFKIDFKIHFYLKIENRLEGCQNRFF
jgi:hypothetical protein